MTANIVLPSLASWTQSHITALYQATSQTTFNEALDAFLAKDAKITVNGWVLISRAN
jgi:predicted benzoate:H+ symporter BenE